MAQICGEMIYYLRHGFKMWKMTQRFGKLPKYLGNYLDTWDTALVFENWLHYIGNGFKISQMPYICGK